MRTNRDVYDLPRLVAFVLEPVSPGAESGRLLPSPLGRLSVSNITNVVQIRFHPKLPSP
jgi:hypothetical protein